MKKIIRTAGILTLVFAASVAVYFFAARKNMQKEEAVYSSMNAPEFPVVYTEFDGKDINALHGYIQNMGNQAVGDTISVLPEDMLISPVPVFSEDSIPNIQRTVSRGPL